MLSPTNGTRAGCSGNATEFYDTVCQFGCNDGYVGSGSQVRRCEKNGTWSGQEFVCEGMSHFSVKLENITHYFILCTDIREDRIEHDINV